MENSQCEILRVEALMVDESILKQDGFRRWSYTYGSLKKFNSPEPLAFRTELPSMETGVYLRWVLPRRLREQQEDGEFPLVPNRWLITRGRKTDKGLVCTSWVLESDCPLSKNMEKSIYENALHKSSEYLITEPIYSAWKGGVDAIRSTPSVAKMHGAYQVRLGAAFNADNWKERAPEMPLFLTSCAPGNPYFSAYTAVNGNILSFYDDLKEVENGELSYWIEGWYSDKNTNKYFSGEIANIPWKRTGVDRDTYKDEMHEIKNNRRLHVAVGESQEDVFRTYVKCCLSKQLDAKERNRMDDAFAALFYHQPGYLNEQAGLQKLRHAIHDGGFEAVNGGSRYFIVSEKDESCCLSEKERELLEKLNSFANEVTSLNEMRFRLFSIWWKQNHLAAMTNIEVRKKAKKYDPALDYSKKESLMYRTVAKYEEVKRLFADMPENGDTELCRQYGETHGVSQGNVLKEVPASRYWKQKNPSFLIAGVEPSSDALLDEDGTKSKREEPKAMRTDVSESWLSQVPEMVARLYEEVREQVGNGEKKEKWHQPWRPMFAEWNVSYYPIPFEEQNQWWFDGTDYRLKEIERKEDGWSYGGISLLDENSKIHFQETLSSQIEKTDDSMVKELNGLNIKSWKLLGQEMVNFSDQIAQLDYRAFRRPINEKIPNYIKTLDDVLGFTDVDEKFHNATGNSIQCAPLAEGEDMPPFHLTQAGSCHVTDLILYDAFGRTLSLIRSGSFKGLLFDKNFPLMVSERMKQKESNNFLLRPRLLQPAKLEVRWTEPIYKDKKGESMVVGFVLVNRFNHSLSICDYMGHYLGEIAVRVNLEGVRKPIYISRSEEAKIDNLKVHNNELAGFIEAKTLLTVDEFEIFLDVLDKALWSMSLSDKSTEETAALIGRPMVLVHGEAWVETEGEPRKSIDMFDIGLDDTESRRKIDAIYKNMKLPIRIGDLYMNKDGVAGYYLADDLKKFYSTAKPSAHTESMAMIGPVGSVDGNYLKVGFGYEKKCEFLALINPYGCVRFYSGLFPVKELSIPEEYVRSAMRTMEIELQTGPLLIRVPNEKEGVAFPRFSDKQGDFCWIEKDDNGEKSYALSQLAIAGDFSNDVTIREGKLKFIVEPNKK